VHHVHKDFCTDTRFCPFFVCRAIKMLLHKGIGPGRLVETLQKADILANC